MRTRAKPSSSSDIISFEGTIQAGFPAPEADVPGRRIDLNEALLINRDSSFLFRIRGDSMTGIGIFDGDTIIVDRSIEARSGQIVLAVVDGEFTVKRLVINSTGFYLHPENDDFPVIELKGESELQIWGVVTSSIRRHLRVNQQPLPPPAPP